MDVSSTKLRIIKEGLRNNNPEAAISILSGSSHISLFQLFKEHKLLLIPLSKEPLYDAYERAVKRVLTDKSEINKELNYVQFIRRYVFATSQLRNEIKELLTPLFKWSLKEFLFVFCKLLERYLSGLSERRFNQLEDLNIENASAERQSELSEWAYNELRGRANDMLFAYTNLINLFGEWQHDDYSDEFTGVANQEEVEYLMNLLSLSANLNSYQFALDKVSYGEWDVIQISAETDKPIFTFGIIDERLDIARDIGLSRGLADTFIKKKNIRWLKELFKGFANEAFDRIWDYYQNKSNIFIIDHKSRQLASEQVIKSLEFLDAEDELLVGLNSDNIEILSAYMNACILSIHATIANFLKNRSNRHEFDFTCPVIDQAEFNRTIESTFAWDQPTVNCLNLFISKLPLTRHLDLFSAPFIRDKGNKIFALDYLSQSEWTNWAKSLFMKGGKTADRVGKSWELYIAGVMRENKWEKVIQGIELKKNGKIATDIDLLAKRGNLLFIIQMKIYYGNGVNHYEQWKFRKRLEHGVHQVKLSEQIIKSDPNLLKAYFSPTELNEIERYQSIVMTNSHYFNGWKFEGICIMSTGSLMQIINGAKVSFTTEDGRVIDEKKYAASDVLTNDEIIDFIEKPLDWRIGEAEYKMNYHTEHFEHAIFKFPLLNRIHPE
jgi:hypothetical protein